MCSAARLARHSGSSSFDDYPGYLMSLLSTMLSERFLIISIIVTTGNIWPTTTWFTITSKPSLSRKLTLSASQGNRSCIVVWVIILTSSIHHHIPITGCRESWANSNQQMRRYRSSAQSRSLCDVENLCIDQDIFENKLLSGNG